MNNTYSLYLTITDFQKQQQRAYNEYMQTIESIADAKGSKYYADREQAAMEKRKATEESARAEARYWLKKNIEGRAAANRKRKAIAPTSEQLAILQALKMRTSATEAELEQIAASMDGNSLGLAVIQDFANDLYARRNKEKGNGTGIPYNGFPRNYLAMAKNNDYPADEVERELSNIASACNRIIDSDGASYVAGLASDRSNKLYGTNYSRDDLKREKIASSESDFFNSVSSIPFETLQHCVNE